MTKVEQEQELKYLGLDEVMLANELSCEWGKRKKCDSLYIEENNKLKKKIAKAIEYIKEQGCYEEDTKQFCDDIDYDKLPNLLEILKGEK